MRLEKVELGGFRSVPGTLSLRVCPELTCLVGANEHGKSNLLEAIDHLDGGEFGEFDKHVYSKNDTHPILTFSLRLSDAERATLLQALASELEEWSARTDASEHARTIGIFEGAIRSVQDEESAVVRIQLRSDNTRSLFAGGARFSVNLRTNSQERALGKWLRATLPQVRLFRPDEELADFVTLADLKAGRNTPFIGLLKLAGVWSEIDELFGGDNLAHRHLLHAGRTLTRRVRKIWSQGAAHTFRFDESNGRLHIGIEDPTTFDTPSRRSLGFKSFFSFYLTLYAETEDVDPEGYILLFDEPGIHLHPQGQKDLLRELRKLSAKNQIVYSTHSPFMIDRNNPMSTVLVRKGLRASEKGTHIVAKPYGENWGALNASLGISPADAFYPADCVLMVEGRSDRLYISRYMGLCQPLTHADLNFLSVIDCERRDELEGYVRMMVSADRRILVMADGDQGGDELGKRIRRIAGKRKEQVRFVDLRNILSVNKEVSVEDVLPIEEWLAALQEYVSAVLGSKCELDGDALIRNARDKSLGRAAGEYLVSCGVLASSRQFSKTTVADIFCRRDLAPPSAGSALARLCSTVAHELGIAPANGMRESPAQIRVRGDAPKERVRSQ